MGGRSKRKGAVGERELASVLREHGYDAHRGVQYHGGPDSPDVVGLPGLHIECKRTERFDLYGALAQAQADAGERIPVVMHRRNLHRWTAVLLLEDFLTIYREWEASR